MKKRHHVKRTGLITKRMNRSLNRRLTAQAERAESQKALAARETLDRNTRPEPQGDARSSAEEPFWKVCRDGNEGRLRRALDDAWAAAGGRPLVWAREYRAPREGSIDPRPRGSDG